MENRWETVETVTDLILGGSKMTEDGDCSHEIKRCLILGSYRQRIKKQKRYFANKGLSSQGYGFSSSHVWMWELHYTESWAPKNWYFFEALKCDVGKDSWESLELQGDPNQSILKEISPEYSLEGLMLKLKLQYFGHLMGRTDSLEKNLMLGKIEGRMRRGWQRMRWLEGITD